MVMVSRLANMMQQPFTGSLVDTAPADNAMTFVEHQFRLIIGAASLGTIVGILLIPTFIAIFSRAIVHLAEERGSIPALMKKGFTLDYIRRGIKHIHKPSFSYLKGIRLGIYQLNYSSSILSLQLSIPLVFYPLYMPHY